MSSSPRASTALVVLALVNLAFTGYLVVYLTTLYRASSQQRSDSRETLLQYMATSAEVEMNHLTAIDRRLAEIEKKLPAE